MLRTLAPAFLTLFPYVLPQLSSRHTGFLSVWWTFRFMPASAASHCFLFLECFSSWILHCYFSFNSYLRKMLASRVRTWLAIQLKWPPCHSPSSQPSLRLYVAFNTTGYFSGLCVTFYSSIYLFMSFLASLFPRMEALWEQHLVLFAPMPLSLRKMLEYNKCIIIRNKLLLKKWMNETN